MKFGSSSTRIAAGLLGIVLAQPSFAAICHQAATVTVGSSGSGVIQFDTPAPTAASVEYTVSWTSSDGPTYPYFALLDSGGNPAVYGQGT